MKNITQNQPHFSLMTTNQNWLGKAKPTKIFFNKLLWNLNQDTWYLNQDTR